MAYDQTLAERIRTLLSDRSDVAERPMFGGLTFMVAGHMCCGVNKDELIVRLGPADADAALSSPHARPMDLTGRPMRGFVAVSPYGLTGHGLARLVGQAVAHAQALPPRAGPRKK
jgi:hypothetical protein